jgi:hypothetical protein
MKNVVKKIQIHGGDITSIVEYKQLQRFFSIVIIGYFGIKIIYALFFKFYPEKYYYKNVQITTNEKNEDSITKDIIIQTFIPGIWNNEMTDFITLIVIVFIIYIFTNSSTKMLVNQMGNLNISFLFGYILGLGYPPIYSNFKNYFEESQTNNIGRYILLFVYIGLVINIITINFSQASQIGSSAKTNYILYITVLILLIVGLVGSRKLSQNYNTVTYFNNDGDNCTFTKNGVIQTSGDKINITLPFISFLTILLFSYEPQENSIKNYYLFIYGILLGIIVSGISYYGIEYFLTKIPQKECNSVNECLIKDMPIPTEETSNNLNSNLNPNLNPNLNSNLNLPNISNEIKNIDLNIKNDLKLSKMNIPIFNTILLIFIILLVIYLVYYYKSNV